MVSPLVPAHALIRCWAGFDALALAGVKGQRPGQHLDGPRILLLPVSGTGLVHELLGPLPSGLLEVHAGLGAVGDPKEPDTPVSAR